MPLSAEPRTRSGGRRPSRQSTSAPIRRSGSAIRSTGRRRIDSSPSKVHSPDRLPRQPPGHDPQERPGVADVDLRRSRAAQPDPLDLDEEPAVVVGLALPDLGSDGRRPPAASRGCRRIQVAGDPGRALRHRADQRGAVGDRLVRRGMELPAQGPCAARTSFAPGRRRGRARGPALGPRARPRSSPAM